MARPNPNTQCSPPRTAPQESDAPAQSEVLLSHTGLLDWELHRRQGGEMAFHCLPSSPQTQNPCPVTLAALECPGWRGLDRGLEPRKQPHLVQLGRWVPGGGCGLSGYCGTLPTSPLWELSCPFPNSCWDTTLIQSYAPP